MNAEGLRDRIVDLAEDGIISSTKVRRQLIAEGYLPEGRLARKRLYYALRKSDRFIHMRHGFYRVNPSYRRPKRSSRSKPLTDEQSEMLRKLRARREWEDRFYDGAR